MDNKEQGLYDKYLVYKQKEGKYVPVDDPVFVLNPKTDRFARVALTAYATAARLAGWHKLADDLRVWLTHLNASLDGEPGRR